MNLKPTREELSLRQQRFFQTLLPNSIAILFNGAEVHRSADTEYAYRPSSNFYYLTGFEEPNAIAVFIPKTKGGDYFLFHLPRDLSAEQWTGKRLDSEEVCRLYGPTQTFSSLLFEEELTKLVAGKQAVFYEFNHDIAAKTVKNIFKNIPKNTRTRTQIPRRLENISPIVQEMRLIKSEFEISLMRKAAEISVEGHKKAIRACRPGLFEYQLEAELIYSFMQQGARDCAYTSIVGSGDNGCTLHYIANNAQIQPNDLVLIDAGAEFGYYASDITRTFPANGKFTAEQQAIYNIVLTAQEKAIASIKPGSPWNTAQEIILQTITEGLKELGILKGNVTDLIEKKAYLPFYPHNSGHWLGLDTHDPSDYQINKKWRPLEPNMVLTIEPGIYIAQDCDTVDSKWRGIGIRIEDDIVVTAKGYDVLSTNLPKSVEDIEEMMA